MSTPTPMPPTPQATVPAPPQATVTVTATPEPEPSSVVKRNQLQPARTRWWIRGWQSGGRWVRRILYEDMPKGDAAGRHAPRLPRFLPTLILLFVLAALGGWLMFVGFARLKGADVAWFWPLNGSAQNIDLFDIARTTVTAAGLFAGVFAVVYAYRKQRVEEAGSRRADAESFSKRYQDAADQLGHEKAAVRLAGIYAMARLADDWEDQRQQCVDVLCAYLRMPGLHETPEGAASEQQVRGTIVNLIGQHLRDHHPTNWCDCKIDITDSELEFLFWRDPTFNKTPNFSRTRFAGMVSISGPTFKNGVHFYDTEFGDQFLLQGANVLDGQITLMRSNIKGGVVTTKALSANAAINLSEATISGQFGITVVPQPHPAGEVALHETKVTEGGHLYLDAVGVPDWDENHRCATVFPRAVIRVSPGGQVRLPDIFERRSNMSGEFWVYKPEG